MHIAHLKSALEAILFLQHKPITLNRLRDIIDETLEIETYKEAMAELVEAYTESSHGIEISEIAGGYVFRTKLEHRDMIRRMNEVTPIKMSQAMLEVLSIVAFNQPVPREKVEDIRGVECGHHLRNLMEKRLVKIVGRSDAVGKPMLYGTTKDFLELFGMENLKDLPTLRDIEEMLPANEVGENEDEENRIRGELQEIVAVSEPLEFSDLESDESALFSELDAKSQAEKEAAAQKRAEEKAAKARAERDEEIQAELDENSMSAEDSQDRDSDQSVEINEDSDSDLSIEASDSSEDLELAETASDAEFSENEAGMEMEESVAANNSDNHFVSEEAKVQEAHGQEEETETRADSDGSEATDLNAPQVGEAAEAENQPDEIAGTVAFGSVSSEQEREWPLDEKSEESQQSEDELGADELKEIAASLYSGRGSAETTEDPSNDGDQ